MFIPVLQICSSGVKFFTNKKRVPTFALVIKEREHIYINLKLVFIEMDMVWRYGVRKIGKIIALKHLFCIQWMMLILFKIARWVYKPQ